MVADIVKNYTAKRIIHINGNIVLAGIVSSMITSLIIDLTKNIIFGIVSIVALTAVIDAILDALVFFILHYFSMNHSNDKKIKHFVKDATHIQFQRFVLSPLYYIIATSLQTILLTHTMQRSSTVLIAYIGALLVTRSIHTIYGLRTGLFD